MISAASVLMVVVLYGAVICTTVEGLLSTASLPRTWLHRRDRDPIPNYPLQIEVVSSAIFGFAPWLEMHHIVVLRDPDGANDGAYTIDFSPAEYNKPHTLKNLLLGRDVPGEIRARWIPKENLSLHEIKHKCMNADTTFFDATRELTYGSPAIEAFLFDIRHAWGDSINLYKRNCQHFATYVSKLAQREFRVL